jgi:EAL domain-containing protein (putative c-di-GMP-specific phosphodiesterase class I)
LWAVAQAGARTAAVLVDELGAGGFKAALDDVGRGSARLTCCGL